MKLMNFLKFFVLSIFLVSLNACIDTGPKHEKVDSPYTGSWVNEVTSMKNNHLTGFRINSDGELFFLATTPGKPKIVGKVDHTGKVVFTKDYQQSDLYEFPLERDLKSGNYVVEGQLDLVGDNKTILYVVVYLNSEIETKVPFITLDRMDSERLAKLSKIVKAEYHDEGISFHDCTSDSKKASDDESEEEPDCD